MRKEHYFTRGERILWGICVIAILVSFFLFDRSNYLTLAASFIGVTSLVLNAKGNPFGQMLMVIFSLLYGIISYSFAYYGEMITYLGMTMPMAVFALVAWLSHPYEGKRLEVKVNKLKKPEITVMCGLTVLVTILFYYILEYFQTANLFLSTISVTTSFVAVYLTFRRSPYFALAYAANDVILILLWVSASFQNMKYLSVVVCFAAFLVNDLYGFVNWRRMKQRQERKKPS